MVLEELSDRLDKYVLLEALLKNLLDLCLGLCLEDCRFLFEKYGHAVQRQDL